MNMIKTILYLLPITLSQLQDDSDEPLVGGHTDQDVTSEDAVKWGQLAHSQWITGTNIQAIQDQCSYTFDRMISYKTQVVAGVNHKIKYSTNSNEEGCLPQLCDAEIFEQAWQEIERVTRVECLPKQVDEMAAIYEENNLPSNQIEPKTNDIPNDIPDEAVQEKSSGSSVKTIFALLIVAVLVFASYKWYTNRNTTPAGAISLN